jgi:hypothetical protein
LSTHDNKLVLTQLRKFNFIFNKIIKNIYENKEVLSQYYKNIDEIEIVAEYVFGNTINNINFKSPIGILIVCVIEYYMCQHNIIFNMNKNVARNLELNYIINSLLDLHNYNYTFKFYD